MATLVTLGDRVRRRLGLGLGSHTVTITYASVADGDTVTVHGIILTCITGSAAVELAQFKKETDATATGDNLEDLIDAIFDSTTGVSSSSSAGVVTITGSRSVTTDNATGFAISSSTYQDEPPYTSDIDQFLLDGQLDIADKCVDKALMAGDTGLAEKFNLTGDGSATELTLPTNFLRATEVRAEIGSDSALYRLKRMSLAELFTIREGKHSDYKVDSADGATKYYAIADDQVYFSAAPVSGAAMAIIYGIKTPQTNKAGTNVWTLTVSDYSNIAAAATVTIDGIVLTHKASATTEFADFKAETSNNETAANIEDLFDNVFDTASGVSISVSAAIATITGAETVTSSDSTRLTVAESTAASCDLPDHLEPLLVDYAVMRVYEQMQRYDMAVALMQFYTQSIMVINQQYGRRR
ncbi:MAG: hypothetical protein E3J60_04640 [Dehalococcoidia bacterium]|nr:MAG: hypothetical protein E3J60_04640 [Dehalococcoidia bacterium]